MTVAVSRADRRAFSEVSELRPVGPGRFDAEVDLAWTIGGKPNGGYLLAMLGRAGVVLATTGVAALTFGLVKGSDWGWGSHATAWAPAASAALIALFVLHCLRSRTPLIQPSLFRSRSFTAASLVAIFFSASFGAMLLSIVLWEQGAWGWSALRSGLAIAPGPIMVPFMSLVVAGRLIAHYGPSRTMALGSLVFGVGVSWWALAITVRPDYLSGRARGSARHRGRSRPRSTRRLRHGWWASAAISVVGIVPALSLLPRPAPATATTTT